MDKPGQLRDVSEVIAALGGNVISVHHERASETMDINGCFLRIVLETKNYEHIQTITTALREAGFHLV
jgi:threonine dehydratase